MSSIDEDCDEIVRLPYCDEVLQKIKSLYPIDIACYNTLIKDNYNRKRFLQLNFTKIKNLWKGDIGRAQQEKVVGQGFIEQLNSSNIISQQLLRAINRYLYGAKIKSVDIGFLNVALNDNIQRINSQINLLENQQEILVEFRKWCDSYNCEKEFGDEWQIL